MCERLCCCCACLASTFQRVNGHMSGWVFHLLFGLFAARLSDMIRVRYVCQAPQKALRTPLRHHSEPSKIPNRELQQQNRTEQNRNRTEQNRNRNRTEQNRTTDLLQIDSGILGCWPMYTSSLWLEVSNVDCAPSWTTVLRYEVSSKQLLCWMSQCKLNPNTLIDFQRWLDCSTLRAPTICGVL